MERSITAETALAASYERASALLLAHARSVIPSVSQDGSARLDLTLELRQGTAARQSVDVQLGTPCSAEGETWIPIAWAPSSFSHLLPSFEGALGVVDVDGSARLTIAGTYNVPLGRVGRFGDGVLGRKIAQQSLRTLVETTARHLDERVSDELAHAPWHPPAYPVDLSERSTRLS